jgi:subtilisin family serine protease
MVIRFFSGNTASDLSKIVPAAYPEVLTVTAMGGQAKTASRNAKNWIVNLLELIRTMLSFTSTDSDGVPGAMGEPLTCAGSESDDHVASFSNYALLPADPRAMREFPNANAKEGERGGAYVTEDSWTNHSLPITSHLLAAPGVCILSTVVHNQFALFSGTSQACPYVVGVLALEYGSGGVDGPCSSLPPQQCMLHLVARSQSYADRMGMGYEFLPWARSERGGDQGTANLTISLEIGHNQTVPVRARRYYGPLVVGRLS